MNENRRTILILALILFCLSFFYVKNEVCCMFAGMRYRGFPYQIILMSKVTEDFEEAKKVYSLNDFELLSQGWNLKLFSDFDPPLWSISFNFIFYLVISRGLVFIFKRVKENYN